MTVFALSLSIFFILLPVLLHLRVIIFSLIIIIVVLIVVIEVTSCPVVLTISVLSDNLPLEFAWVRIKPRLPRIANRKVSY